MTLEESKKYTNGQKIELWYWNYPKGLATLIEFTKHGVSFYADDDGWDRPFSLSALSVFETKEQCIEDRIRRIQKDIKDLEATIEAVKNNNGYAS